MRLCAIPLLFNIHISTSRVTQLITHMQIFADDMETRGLKVNINKTKLLMMVENLLLGHKGEGTHVGFAAKKLDQT